MQVEGNTTRLAAFLPKEESIRLVEMSTSGPVAHELITTSTCLT